MFDGYYLFINRKPHFVYDTEQEAIEAAKEYCFDNDIEFDELDYDVYLFHEFNETFPDPYADLYDELD